MEWLEYWDGKWRYFVQDGQAWRKRLFIFGAKWRRLKRIPWWLKLLSK